jgi:Type VI secretion system VasI, EvfG, VC_A0118
MRTLLISALAATLVGCSCLLPPQAGMESCADANGFACFDRTAASQPIEPKPASFQTYSATTEIKSTIAAKTEKPSSAHARDRAHLATKTAKPTMIAAKVEPSASVLRGDAEKTAPASPNEPPTGSAQNQPADTAWVVSETTSPVDYSPLITAVIHSTSSVKDAPSTLAVRCSGPRTELLLRTEGAWRASRSSEVQVDYQINDQPFVRLQWTVSADGKAASYKDDAVGLLRSLPEGAQLKIGVFDRQGLGQEATFQLTGLDSVRKKIGLACKWPSTAETMSSGKR